MNFLTVSGVAETRCSSAACSFNTAIFIGFASIQAIRTMTRAVTATVMIVLHFNKATKPSYVRVASFRSPFDTIIYFLPCPENRGLFNHMCPAPQAHARQRIRSEEHTSELQSLMRISYAVFCLKKKTKKLKIQIINKSNHKQ